MVFERARSLLEPGNSASERSQTVSWSTAPLTAESVQGNVSGGWYWINACCGVTATTFTFEGCASARTARKTTTPKVSRFIANRRQEPPTHSQRSTQGTVRHIVLGHWIVKTGLLRNVDVQLRIADGRYAKKIGN